MDRSRGSLITFGLVAANALQDAYLVHCRQNRIPYKCIAEKVRKSELACRLHYHQIAVVRKREEEDLGQSLPPESRTPSPVKSNSSGSEFPSPVSAPSTPVQGTSIGTPFRSSRPNCQEHHRACSLPDTATPIWSTINDDGTVLVLYSPSQPSAASAIAKPNPTRPEGITASPHPLTLERDLIKTLPPLSTITTPVPQSGSSPDDYFDVGPVKLAPIDYTELQPYLMTTLEPSFTFHRLMSQAPQMRCSVDALLN